MTALVRATCPGCGQPRQVTVAGVFRRHRRGQITCPGAGCRPSGNVTLPASSRRPYRLTSPPPPDEPAAGRSCDAGHCDRPSIGWRLFRGQREWLPVCGICMDGPAGRTRIYDPENEERMIDSERECCEHYNQETTDDGDVIYPDLCHCICHTGDS